MPPPEAPTLALEDAVPNIVIGLIGVPVAFSLQTIADTSLHDISKLGDGLLYFIFVLAFYGLSSVILSMSFELGKRVFKHQDDGWQRYLIANAVRYAIPTFLLIGSVLGIGISFANSAVPVKPYGMGIITIGSLAISGWFLTLPPIPRAGGLDRLKAEFPDLLSFGFAIASALLVVYLAIFLAQVPPFFCTSLRLAISVLAQR